MAFLDISLNSWSMIVFLFYALFLMSMTISMLGGTSNIMLFSTIVFTFIAYNIVLVLYSISTSQIGFLLMVIFQFFLTLLTFLYVNQNTLSKINYKETDEDK